MAVFVVFECFFAKAAGGEKASAVANARAMVRTLFFISVLLLAGPVWPHQFPLLPWMAQKTMSPRRVRYRAPRARTAMHSLGLGGKSARNSQANVAARTIRACRF